MRWSKLKQIIEGGFAPAAAGRVSVHVTRYHRAHDAEGRWAILIDGIEVGGIGCIIADREQSEFIDQFRKGPDGATWEAQERADALLCAKAHHTLPFFLATLFAYTSLSVEAALGSTDAVLRTLAILDRRTGKRRLMKLASTPLATDLERRCLEFRLQVEGLNPPADFARIGP